MELNFKLVRELGIVNFFKYFEHQQSFVETVAEIKKDSRHYAKRQLTWFRNKMDVDWFDIVTKQNTITEIEDACQQWL